MMFDFKLWTILFLCFVISFCASVSLGNSNKDIFVKGLASPAWACELTFAGRSMQCSLGKNGVAPEGKKVEGDGFTPTGSFQLRRAFFRADRISRPSTGALQNVTSVLHPSDGWCDDPSSPEYNTYLKLPSPYHHETLWEVNESFYDLFAVIGYNDDPVVAYKGSAIFFHTTQNYGSTAGCIALSLNDLQWVLERIEINTFMHITGGKLLLKKEANILFYIIMSDRDALMYIYENTQMHPLGWNVETNWNTEKRCSTWSGIRIDAGAHVTSVVLSENRLMGILLETDRLRQLPNLRTLFLNSNFLKGAIPPCIGTVTSLVELNLAWNEFVGEIPETIYNCTSLTVLRLDNNRLTGVVSESMRNLQQLRHFDVSRNDLTGVIPMIGGESKFPQLGVCNFLPGNNFSGHVPADAIQFKTWCSTLESARKEQEDRIHHHSHPDHHHHEGHHTHHEHRKSHHAHHHSKH